MLQKTDSTPVFLLDDSGVILECNWRACEFAGLKCEEIEGKHFGEFVLTDSDTTGVLTGETSHFITRFAHKDGSHSTVVSIVNGFSRKGNQFHNLTIFDVSSGRSMSCNDRHENMKLLAAYIAHDFNNILTGIMGSLSILREGVDNAIQYDELLGNAEAGALRAKMLTDQILAFSRGEITSIFNTGSITEANSEGFSVYPEGDSGRLLLLESDRLVAETAIGMLNSLGYTVDVVTEGGAALEKFREALKKADPYKVAILDRTIEGGMDGLTAVKFILEMKPDTAVIISSGYAGDEILMNYKNYGFKSILPKPYTVRELFESLNTALDR